MFAEVRIKVGARRCQITELRNETEGDTTWPMPPSATFAFSRSPPPSVATFDDDDGKMVTQRTPKEIDKSKTKPGYTYSRTVTVT